MIRPCYLVIDREYAGSISTRKLVIETAKFNVITAYSSVEAIATLKRYPALDGAVMDTKMPDMAADEMIAALHQVVPGFRVVAVCPPGDRNCELADEFVDSFDPAQLLLTLRRLHPEFSRETENHREAQSRRL